MLQQLPQEFKKAVRVYITATPWAVRNLIAKAEERYELPLCERIMRSSTWFPYPDGEIIYRPGMQMYDFPSQPRNYRLHALPSAVRSNDGLKDLVDRIKKPPESDKWVIFVNAKPLGMKLTKALGHDAAYLDAEHKSGPIWEKLAAEEKFSERVLVTTAVTDCGVNINDPAVKHVVLFSTDHVQFVQELGRKRLRGDEELHVYVPELSPQQWRRLNARNEQLIQLVDNVSQHSEWCRTQCLDLWYDEDREARCLLPIDANGTIHVNRCAEQVVRQRALFFRELEERWAAGDKHPFLSIVCQWLGLPESALVDALGDSNEAKFLHFLEENCERVMEGKEGHNNFSKKFRDLYTATFGPRDTGSRRKSPWGAEIIQTELDKQKIPYKLTAKKGVWLLTKKENEVSSNV